MKTTVLLDADVVAYRFANAAQQTTDWGDGVKSFVVDDEQDVFALVRNEIDNLESQLDADETIVCLSCATKDKWRTKLWPQYTSRKAEKPLLLEPVKQFMRDHWKTYERPSLEADDILGILSTHPNIIPGRRIIVSIDKDLKTIPGLLFNPDKDDFPQTISADEADYWWMYQTLTGDRVDCYPGLPGCGPETAPKILSDEGRTYGGVKLTRWEAVVMAYELKGLTKDDAILQARLARILRHTDYDFARKQPILWSPK